MKKTILSNGLTLLYLETKNDPISACHLFIPVGAATEDPLKSGITTLMWGLISKGTKIRSAKKLAEDIESMGAYIGAGASHDYSEISCHSISDCFLKTLEIMSEMVFSPSFLDEEFQKEKKALMASIRAKKENIFTVTQENLHLHLYKEHPYSRPSSGKENTVNNLKVSDIRNWHSTLTRPEGAILSIATNIPFETALIAIENGFGKNAWPISRFSDVKLIGKPAELAKPVFEANTAKFEQAFLMLGFSAPHISSPDYIPLKILGGILGGGMSARLFQNLREKNGLAYDVGAYYPTRKSGSGFLIYMGLQISRIQEAKERIIEELQGLQKSVIPVQEFEQAINYLKGTFVLDHQTNSQRAHYLGWWEIMGLGYQFDFDYPQKLSQVTPSQLQTLANSYFSKPYVLVETHPESKSN